MACSFFCFLKFSTLLNVAPVGKVPDLTTFDVRIDKLAYGGEAIGRLQPSGSHALRYVPAEVSDQACEFVGEGVRKGAKHASPLRMAERIFIPQRLPYPLQHGIGERAVGEGGRPGGGAAQVKPARLGDGALAAGDARQKGLSGQAGATKAKRSFLSHPYICISRCGGGKP